MRSSLASSSFVVLLLIIGGCKTEGESAGTEADPGAVQPDSGLVEDAGGAQDPGKTQDPGVASDPGPTADPGPASDPGQAADQGSDTASDPGPDPGPPDAGAPPAVVVTAGSHTVVTQPGASPSELKAADELRLWLGEVLGTEPAVAELSEPAEGPMIVLGQGPLASALGVEPSAESLGEQGFAMKTAPPHVVIAGTPGAGTLYGAHRFLERYAGVRWFAPGVTRADERDSVEVPELDITEQPAFLWRHTSYEWPGADEAFRARLTNNDGSGGADREWGLRRRHDGRAHSYFRHLSPGDYYDAHPEYFSEVGGKRLRDETQLCLTNPEVLDIVAESMLARMESKPDMRQHNFSQMDHYNYCTCETCSAMNEQYQTTGGTQFWFVSKLAERTSGRFPDKSIGTLAYTYTVEPPVGLEMHPNTAVWLCHMYPSCDSHPIHSCSKDADYKRRALAWSEVAPQLYVWHYIVDFTHYYSPFPNFRAMAADLGFYRDIGVTGIYLQGMGHNGGGGEFSLLRPYYGVKLLWDPDLDPDTLRREFLEGYYGSAWTHIWDYSEMLEDKVEQEDIHMHLYTNPAQGYLDDETLAAAEAHFDAAAAAVEGDPVLSERVDVARMPMTYARFFPRNGYEIADGMLRWRGEPLPLTEVLGFKNKMAAHGFEMMREFEGDPQTMVLMWAILGNDLKVETIENGALRVDIVPALAGRALRITELATGRTITAHDVRKNLFFPFAGGLEDRVGEGALSFGWVESSTVVERPPNGLTIELSTFSGQTLRRTYQLDASSPELRVHSVATNPKDGPMEMRLRSHLELAIGPPADVRIQLTSAGGQAVDRDLSLAVAGEREGEHFFGDDVPGGSWTFVGEGGLRVTQSFKPAQVESTWVYAYPAELGEVEVELWAPRRTRGPGESVEIEQRIRIE
jgi:hypothetical protein